MITLILGTLNLPTLSWRTFCGGHYFANIARTLRKLAYLLLLVSQPKIIEWLLENQAFLRSYDSAPRPPLPHLHRQQLVSLSQSSCVSPVQLTDGRGGGRGGRGAKSYYHHKAWPSIKHSILSDPCCPCSCCTRSADLLFTRLVKWFWAPACDLAALEILTASVLPLVKYLLLKHPRGTVVTPQIKIMGAQLCVLFSRLSSRQIID
jgi:hypothetical protein